MTPPLGARNPRHPMKQILAILLLAGLAIPACAADPVAAPDPARAADPIRVGIPQPAFSFLPLDVAIQTGIFQRHGVTIAKSIFNGGAKLHQAVAAGSIDIAFGAGPEFGFLAKGSPEHAVAATADAPADLAITVLAGGPIHSVADLKGRRVSISTKGSLTEWGGKQLSRQQGWGSDGFQLVPLGAFTSQTAALETHQIDAMITAAGNARQVEATGTGRVLMTFEHIVDNFHINVIYASNDFIRAHPGELRAFLAGIFDAIRYEHEHRPQTVALATEILGMAPTLAGKMYDQLMPVANDTGRFNPAALDTLAQAMVDMGEVEQKPDMQQLIDPDFLPTPKS